MTSDDLNLMKKWFSGYVSGFYSDDAEYNRAINLKEKHTRRVCGNIIMIAESLNLSTNDKLVAETAALFHDVGRFRQFKEYGTFRDMDSENHAKMGIKEIKAHQVLDSCPDDEKKTITKAIACHNALKLPESSDTELRLIRMLRDADKLDIWKVFSDYCHNKNEAPDKTISLGLPDIPEYSDKIVSALLDRQMILMKDLKTFNDFKLMQIGWVYDLNFLPSFQAVMDRGLIEKIASTLPQSDKIQLAVESALEHAKGIAQH